MAALSPDEMRRSVPKKVIIVAIIVGELLNNVFRWPGDGRGTRIGIFEGPGGEH